MGPAGGVSEGLRGEGEGLKEEGEGSSKSLQHRRESWFERVDSGQENQALLWHGWTQGFFHRQGGVRIFDAGVKMFVRGIQFWHDVKNNGPFRVKILTPRHLCENLRHLSNSGTTGPLLSGCVRMDHVERWTLNSERWTLDTLRWILKHWTVYVRFVQLETSRWTSYAGCYTYERTLDTYTLDTSLDLDAELLRWEW